jgi:hypothetical protein
MNNVYFITKQSKKVDVLSTGTAETILSLEVDFGNFDELEAPSHRVRRPRNIPVTDAVTGGKVERMSVLDAAGLRRRQFEDLEAQVL